MPRYLVDVSKRDQSTTLLGRRYASPFGISPTGLAGLFRPDADRMLARAAAAADIPFLLSSAANGCSGGRREGSARQRLVPDVLHHRRAHQRRPGAARARRPACGS